MSEDRDLIRALRRRLEAEPNWSEVEVDADLLRDLLALAECEVERREQRTVRIRTPAKGSG